MLVKDRMTPDPITITEDTPFQDALKLIRDRRIRRLPVLDHQGKLVGIVAEKDLLYAAPSPATALSIFEVHYHLARLRISQVMHRKVITTTPETTVEEAAQMMADHRIGCLPVMSEGKLVGIITETDIFKTFLEMLGTREHGLRLTLRVPDRKGVLAAIATEIARLDGNILNVATLPADEPGYRYLIIKQQGASQAALIPALEALGDEVIDSREV